MSIKQKCDELGISMATYYFRIKSGMTPEQALSVPNKWKTKNQPAVKTKTTVSEHETERENPNVDLDCVFALFQQENGKLKPIYNGDLSEVYLLKIATTLLNEATQLLKLMGAMKE